MNLSKAITGGLSEDTIRKLLCDRAIDSFRHQAGYIPKINIEPELPLSIAKISVPLDDVDYMLIVDCDGNRNLFYITVTDTHLYIKKRA